MAVQYVGGVEIVDSRGPVWVLRSLLWSPGRDGGQPQGAVHTSTYLMQSRAPQICARESEHFTVIM